MHKAQGLFGPVTPRGERNTGHLEPEFDVPEDVQPRKERWFLEYHQPVGTGSPNNLSVSQNLPFRIVVQTGHQIEQRRFAATGRPDDADELSVSNGQIDPMKRTGLSPSGGVYFTDPS